MRRDEAGSYGLQLKVDERDTSDDLMDTSAQMGERLDRVLGSTRLSKYVTIKGNHRIGGENIVTWMSRSNDGRFAFGEFDDEALRVFGLAQFIELARSGDVRDAKYVKQLTPTG